MLNLKDNNGLTALHYTVQESQHQLTTRCIRALLLNKAESSPKDNKGLVPLDYTNQFEDKDNPEIIKL